MCGVRAGHPEDREKPLLPHIVLIGVIVVSYVADVFWIAPLVLIGAGIAMRSRMLVIAGAVLIVLYLVLLLYAGVIGGSVGGGMVD